MKTHSHKKRKDSLETRAVLLIFSFQLEISRVAVQRIQQNREKWRLLGGLLSENDFKAVLTTFCICDHGVNASEAVQKIATDQKRFSEMLLVCYNLLNSQNISISNSEKSLVTRKPPLQKLHRKRSNNWLMVSFIDNGSEITTWMGYSCKTKNTKSKAAFLREEHLF